MTDFFITGLFVLNGLTFFFAMFFVNPPENIRKPLFFWCVQGGQKGILRGKGLNKYSLKKIEWKSFYRNKIPLQVLILLVIGTKCDHQWDLIYHAENL